MIQSKAFLLQLERNQLMQTNFSNDSVFLSTRTFDLEEKIILMGQFSYHSWPRIRVFSF